MSATITHLRTRRCDTRALQLVRSSVKESLAVYKAEKNAKEPLWLTVLFMAVRCYIAFAWFLMIVSIIAVTLALPAFCIGLLVGWLTR